MWLTHSSHHSDHPRRHSGIRGTEKEVQRNWKRCQGYTRADSVARNDGFSWPLPNGPLRTHAHTELRILTRYANTREWARKIITCAWWPPLVSCNHKNGRNRRQRDNHRVGEAAATSKWPLFVRSARRTDDNAASVGRPCRSKRFMF